jgi:hypothetical protein
VDRLDRNVAARDKKTPIVSNERTSKSKKGPYDPDRCPAGWDAATWSLTLLFEQLAAKDGIELQAGRPVIYGSIAKRAAGYRDRPPEFWKDSKGVVRTWDVCVAAAIREFWTYTRNDQALDLFCSPVTFNEMLRTVWERARNKRMVAKFKAKRDSASG